MRFGIGRDFFINILFTICGYFPGHGHKYVLLHSSTFVWFGGVAARRELRKSRDCS